MALTRRGWTLVEVVVALALFGILSLVLAALIRAVGPAIPAAAVRAELSRDARNASEIVRNVLVDASESSLRVGRVDTNEAPFSRLGFMTVAGNPVRIYQRGRELLLEENGAGGVPETRVLARHVRQVAFGMSTTRDPGSILFSLTLQKEGLHRTPRTHLHYERMEVMNP